jgi:hypothetical protein
MEPQSKGALETPATLLAYVRTTTLLVLDTPIDNVYHRLFGRS